MDTVHQPPDNLTSLLALAAYFQVAERAPQLLTAGHWSACLPPPDWAAIDAALAEHGLPPAT
jgi:hypothetical protein